MKKKMQYTLVCIRLLCISREGKTKKTLLIGSKFSFPYVDILPDVSKNKIILKNSNLQILVVFPPIFVADTKIIYGFNFVAPLTSPAQSLKNFFFG